MIDQVRVEVLDLLLRQIDLLETRDDLVVREEPLLLSVLDELLELLDLRKCDIDGEHWTSAFSRGWTGGAATLPDDLPRHTKSRIAPALTIGFGYYNGPQHFWKPDFNPLATRSRRSRPRLLRAS